MKIDKSLTAHNLGSPRIKDAAGAALILGIVLHDTAGSGSHNDTLYLTHPGDGRDVSVDFTIERDGTVFQLNPDLAANFTFHAGRATKFYSSKTNRTFFNRDVNRVCIGIELVQKANLNLSPLWPTEQIRSAAELCYSLCSQYGLTKEAVTTHAKVITDGSRSDPRQFPFNDFWFFFNRLANTPAVDPPPGPLGNPVMYEVAAGDTLWSIAKRFSTTIEELKHLNGINEASNLITPGQKLIVKK